MVTDLSNWTGRPAPRLESVAGRYVQIEQASLPEDSAALFSAICGAGDDALWEYIPMGPFDNADMLGEALVVARERHNWRTYLIRAAGSGDLLGMANYMRIRPDAGSAEVGGIVFSRKLQRTPAASEAMYLMARHIFDDLGYRRYEWKCNDANEASKRAALRFGFRFEGVFRQDMVVKGRNRDTAWYSMLDGEWPGVKAAFETWLAPENFDQTGRQRRSLVEIREHS